MKRKTIILIVSAVVVLVGAFFAIEAYQQRVKREATLDAFFNGEGKPITEIADEFEEKYGTE